MATIIRYVTLPDDPSKVYEIVDQWARNEISQISGDANYKIVSTASELPNDLTIADRKMYYVIDEKAFYLWNGTAWVKTVEVVEPLTNTQMSNLINLI